MNKFVTLLAGLSFHALVACSASTGSDGENGENGGSARSAQSADGATFCERICRRSASCDGDVDVQTCAANCSDLAIDKLRADAVDAVAACYEGSDCKSILTEESRLGSCLEEAQSSIGANAGARTFCDAWIEKADECGQGAIDRAVCIGAMKIYSAETLEAATSCTKKACSIVTSCIKAETSLGG